MSPSNLSILPDQQYQALIRAANERQVEARAPGSWANYNATVENYTAHCRRFAIPRLTPTPLQIRCWVEERAARLCPSSVANAVSHLRLFFKLKGATTEPLDHITVRLAMDALKRSKEHRPRMQRNAPVDTIRRVVLDLMTTPPGAVVAFAVLVMFYTGARQSEVAPRSAATFDHTRNTTRGDVWIQDGSLHIDQKWAKNMQANNQSRLLVLAPAPDPRFCPVRAYAHMLTIAPTRYPTQPLLVFPGDGQTMTIPYISRRWKAAQPASPTPPYTLHAIRRAAATVAFQSGSTELEVQRFGGWASDAHKRYINTHDSCKVNRALVRAITKQ